MSTLSQPARSRHRREGITLLEVLIASGILVIGLSSIAAILPAAGSLLGEAATNGRVAAIANNAFRDIELRPTLSASLFAMPPLPAVQIPRTVVIGEMFRFPDATTAPVPPTPPGGYPAPPPPYAPLTTDYPSPPTAIWHPFGVVPAAANGFFQVAAAGVPVASASDLAAYGGVWYGLTATPLYRSEPVVVGSVVRVSVAVFRTNAPDRARLLLERVPPRPVVEPPGYIPTGVYRLNVLPAIPAVPSAMTTAQKDSRSVLLKSYRERVLKGCSWVAVVLRRSNGTAEIRWLVVANSWVTYWPGEAERAMNVNVAFSDAGRVYDAERRNGSLEAYGFQGLLHVEERIVPVN